MSEAINLADKAARLPAEGLARLLKAMKAESRPVFVDELVKLGHAPAELEAMPTTTLARMLVAEAVAA